MWGRGAVWAVGRQLEAECLCWILTLLSRSRLEKKQRLGMQGPSEYTDRGDQNPPRNEATRPRPCGVWLLEQATEQQISSAVNAPPERGDWGRWTMPRVEKRRG